MSFKYYGSGHYCYANSTSMALASRGYGYEPGYIECLATVGISSFWTSGSPSLPFFSSAFGDPDSGISAALTNLGFAYDRSYIAEVTKSSQQDAFKELSSMLESGSVIAGPVDMGLLKHNPIHGDLGGVDHFVLIYKMTDEGVFFHDPAGFPYVNMSVEAFGESWKAEHIYYKKGAYSMWGNINRTTTPSSEEIYKKTNERIVELLKEEYTEQEKFGGSSIRRLVNILEEGVVPPYMENHLKFFSFQLGARRCSDYAEFYAPYNQDISDLKVRQGEAFGCAQSALQRGEGKLVYKSIMEIAELEDAFREQLLRSI